MVDDRHIQHPEAVALASALELCVPQVRKYEATGEPAVQTVVGEIATGGNASAPADQTLTAHKAEVLRLTWNSARAKLTSGDASGLVIVWAIKQGRWAEEMINNK